MLSCILSKAGAQTLESDLQSRSDAELVSAARQFGDPGRGAIIFFGQQMACSKCHIVGGDDDAMSLGPDLSALGSEVSDEAIVQSVLYPSKVIRPGYQSVSVLTVDGTAISALLVEQTAEKLVLRDVARNGTLVTIAAGDIEQLKKNDLSIMPAGQINQLNSQQQFFDLIRYLMEIRDGGADRAKQLQPSPSMLAVAVPEYENQLDHAGLIRSWNDGALTRGEVIYKRVCANCHGTHDQPGSLPTSLRFAEGKFKNGSDPLAMYRTLTHGFGQMAPQSWMVPSQKYDVIHYIRTAYLQSHNPKQYTPVDDDYLASLPKGDTLGPEPSNIESWSAMNYGPSLAHTYEIPGDKHNFAYKGIAVRLDPGAGGVSRGQRWMVFDTDTLRVAGGWSASADAGSNNNFIDWRSIQFNGQHGVHPRIVGNVAFANSTGPGWGNPIDGNFRDDQRVLGRDGKQYGPLPRQWGQFKGLYHYDQQTIFSYNIGTADILELPSLSMSDDAPLMLRTFNIGPRSHDLILQVAEHPAKDAVLTQLEASDRSTIRVAQPESDVALTNLPLRFDGNTHLQIKDADAFDLTGKDFTIVARIKTKGGGTIFSLTDGGEKWVPNGQAFFVRGGRLVFDIGWVGAVTGRSKVDDGKWHVVAVTYQQASKRVRLYVDGQVDSEGVLKTNADLPNGVVRIGFASTNFPQPASFFQGEMSQVRFYQQSLSQEITESPLNPLADSTGDSTPMAAWNLDNQIGDQIADKTANGRDGTVRRGIASVRPQSGPFIAGYAPRDLDAQWMIEDGNLRLRIPAGDQQLRFSVWIPSDLVTDTTDDKSSSNKKEPFRAPTIRDAALDLKPLTQGGPSRWPQTISTQATIGVDGGPLAADVLAAPESNPWLALTRFTGLDFYPDGRIAVCSWDGDVWIVTPLEENNLMSLQWRRIASGLFQPLGLKIVEGKIHVICRDQLAVLHDLNDDGEIDYYQCLNNDHQVSEHFHEFAMGLQTDPEGNFYYAKSGCHGKAAVVPHHGTLLRITADGSRTEILANGFRAANGVCLNPDGSFVVTDQEGFWNPKNRINWVTLSDSGRPNFYGNMLGYHDVTDASDTAMEQPLCWITNAVDRSPAELLWVESQRWGPLNGSLLNLSYGYGKVFLVLHEKVGGAIQGGLVELPLAPFPTGVMRGRFHPGDGQLYLCGMFAWAGNATHPGGLYRVRYTERPMELPIGLSAHSWGLEIAFSESLDPESAANIENYGIEAWDLKRSAKYGSEHHNQRSWKVTSALLMPDGKTVRLIVPDIAPTWGMEIRYRTSTVSGKQLTGKIHNSIQRLSNAVAR